MADIILRSRQQILGQMIAELLAETDLTDLSPGSVFLTTLETASGSDFSQEEKLLQLMQIRNIDKATGVDLENLASELGLTPPRLGAASSNVKLTISDSDFSKVSSTIFAGGVSPAAGDTAIKVTDASAFDTTGTIYIGRGTSTSEAIAYITLSNTGSYWLMTLASALTKDHLVGEEVVMAQGGDRLINSGTVVRVPSVAGNPAILFATLTDQTLADGEDSIGYIDATANEPGTAGNVGYKKISEFASLPWSTAEVINDLPATGGIDAETDSQLRQRIKDHVHNLARGTERAIIRAVIGASDPDEGKRIVTAFYKAPTTTGQIGILYIDDGTGFSPSFAGIGEETIVTSANGIEQFFQLQEFPLVKAQAVSIGQEPFSLIGGERILFEVDGASEERSIPGDKYRTPGVVLAQEVVEAINRTFTTVETRAKNGRIFVAPASDSPDYVRIGVATTNNANEVIRFPTTKAYTVRLYKNDVLLEKNGADAVIQSFPNTAWPPFSSSESLQLNIDGILSPLITVTDADFAALTSSTNIIGASAADWAIVINAKFIGVTATEKDDGSFVIASNRGKNSQASLAVVAGSLVGTLFADNLTSTGKSSEYKINTLLGQIELSTRLSAGDQLKAGNINTQGFVETTAQSAFDLSTTLGTAAKLVLITDSTAEILPFAQTLGALTFSSTVAGIQRITGATSQFSDIQSDDWCYTYNLPRSALLRVYAVDPSGAWVDLFDPDPLTGPTADTPNGNSKQIVFFRSTGTPQEVTLTTGVAVPGSTIVSDINSQLSGGEALLLDSGKIRIQTLRLDGTGSLTVAAVLGTSNNLGFIAGVYESNDPHIAAMESGDLAGLPTGKLTIATDDNTSPFDDLQVDGTPFTGNTYHNRPIYTYKGAASQVLRQPLQKLTTSRLTLRNTLPLQTVGLGQDFEGVSSDALEFGESDNMVFIIDDDAAKKTFDIPMYLDATIVAPSVPSSTQFDAQDGAGDNLGTSSRWLGYRFDDYRCWFKARVDLPASIANSQIRIRANQFGLNGRNLWFGVFYPTIPTTEPVASFSIDATNSKVNLAITLGSGAERVIGVTPTQPIQVAYSGVGPYTYSFQFVPPVDLTSVLPGDILSVLDTSFTSNNRGQMLIDTVVNLNDPARSYEFKTEDLTDITVTGTTGVSLIAPPTQAAETGDYLEATSITQQITARTTSTVDVNMGGAFAAGGGSFVINATTYTYTSYTSGTGQFAGVSPDPVAQGVIVGDFLVQDITPIQRLITTISTPTSFIVATGFADGTGYDMTIKHKALTADAPPSFAVATGDKIQVSSQLLTVTSVVSTTIFQVSSTFSFTGLQPGVVSRLKLTATRTTSGTNETITTTSSQSVRVFEADATNNVASNLITIINGTAGVKDLVTASNSGASTGAGIITKSTQAELGTSATNVQLTNGEGYVLASANANPCLTLKFATDLTPEIGEEIRLVPMTPQNIADHFNKKQISGLSIASNIDLVSGGRKVQVASKIAGGVGQVYAVGGKASGNNVLTVRGSGLTINSNTGQVEVDRSSLDLLMPGHTVKLYQTGRAKKTWTGSSPTSSTTVEIQLYAPGIGKILFGVPFATILTYAHAGTVEWVVRKLTRNRVRFEISTGTATLPATLKASDWVLVGNGTSYAGTTPVQFFASANQGYYQVRETDASTYFDIEKDGVEQYVSATSSPFVFMSYHSAIPGDQLQINIGTPLSAANIGTFEITDIVTTSSMLFTSTTSFSEGPVAISSTGTDSIRVLDQGFTSYRKVLMTSPSVFDPTNRGIVTITPGYDISMLTEGQQAKISLPNRLGFGTDPVPGISGYQYWTGLKRRAQRILNGYAPDSNTFPGYCAAGSWIEAREPQIQRVSLNIKVKTKEGTVLASISDLIKSSVVGFINSLGLSEDVVLSEIVSIVQAISGVEAVVLVNPILDTERIVVADKAIVRTSPNEITLS